MPAFFIILRIWLKRCRRSFTSVTLLPLPRALAAALGTAGRKLVLGVRPEQVCLEGSRWAHGEPVGEPIVATVQVVEYGGDQVFLELDALGTTLIARVEPDFSVERGRRVRLWFQPESLHLFDADTELALTQAAPA